MFHFLRGTVFSRLSFRYSFHRLAERVPFSIAARMAQPGKLLRLGKHTAVVAGQIAFCQMGKNGRKNAVADSHPGFAATAQYVRGYSLEWVC